MRLRLSETDLQRLAAALACMLRPGDTIALHGDLGAGKTTFARFLITCLIGHETEIPSPTFSLVQTYDTPRMAVAHFDLYRLGGPDEIDELGLAEAAETGLALVEWPERAGGGLPAARLDLALDECDDPSLRDVILTGHGELTERLARFEARMDFLARSGWGDAAHSYLQGDASARSYVRLRRHGAPDGERAILMDAPAMADGPPVRDGLPYSRIAHLAEDVGAFVAVADALREGGLHAPEIFAADLATGFLLIEDLGTRVFGTALAAGKSQDLLWRAATDTLAALRRIPAPEVLPLRGGCTHELPPYDRGAMQIEVELLPDWYWPAIYGEPCPAPVRDEFLSLWNDAFAHLDDDEPGWVLRDYHSPNLIWLPQQSTAATAKRTAAQKVGIIDFQDAMRGPAAYDLVSLLQDARLDVPANLEASLFDRYCAAVAADEPGFNRRDFRLAYAILGAQRNSKILGIFARLARRDGKPGYLRHLPRIWDYLARNLAHPGLTDLHAWYDAHFPEAARKRAL